MVAVVAILGLLPGNTVEGSPDDAYADGAITISRVTPGTNSAGVAIDTTADDADDGSDATGAPDWPGGSSNFDKITVLGIDEKSTVDPADDDRGSVVLAFTDNVCLDGAGPDLYIYDAWGPQSLLGNESADIDVAIGAGSFAAAGSVSPGAYALDVSGALTYFTRVRVTATDFAGQLTAAGLDLDAVECLNSVNITDISLSAGPSGDVNAIGTEHTVIATLTPAIEGVEVTFTITGPNSAESGTADTNASGVASFTYTGSSAGVDSIAASVTFEGTTIQGTAVTKTWYDKFVSGGGQLLEEDGKRPEWNVISFGGFAASAGSAGYIGEWEVNFHNVGDDTYDKSSFHTTSITEMNFFVGVGGCIAMNFTAMGVWNGTPGYKMIFRAQDAGEPGNLDNARIQLFNPSSGEVYDTHDGDFTDQSNCVGTARTLLDNGNLQMADLTTP